MNRPLRNKTLLPNVCLTDLPAARKDSDLTLFGCESILFKMDLIGNGVLYEKSKLGLCLGNKADAFDFSKVRFYSIHE